jgi:hypothetical protein
MICNQIFSNGFNISPPHPFSDFSHSNLSSANAAAFSTTFFQSFNCERVEISIFNIRHHEVHPNFSRHSKQPESVLAKVEALPQ